MFSSFDTEGALKVANKATDVSDTIFYKPSDGKFYKQVAIVDGGEITEQWQETVPTNKQWINGAWYAKVAVIDGDEITEQWVLVS